MSTAHYLAIAPNVALQRRATQLNKAGSWRVRSKRVLDAAFIELFCRTI